MHKSHRECCYWEFGGGCGHHHGHHCEMRPELGDRHCRTRLEQRWRWGRSRNAWGADACAERGDVSIGLWARWGPGEWEGIIWILRGVSRALGTATMILVARVLWRRTTIPRWIPLCRPHTGLAPVGDLKDREEIVIILDEGAMGDKRRPHW